jgi:hypothetical protein
MDISHEEHNIFVNPEILWMGGEREREQSLSIASLQSISASPD